MGLSNNDGKRQFLHVEAGKLLANRGKGNPPEPFEVVDGILESISIYEDAAPGYDLKSRARIVLTEGDEKFIIECGAGALFSRMFAAHLPGIKKGDHIRIKVRQPGPDAGQHHKKMTSCFVESKDGEKYAYNKIVGETEGERLSEVEKRFMNHEAWIEFSKNKSEESYEDQAKKICSDNGWLTKTNQADFEAFKKVCAGPWPSVMVNGVAAGCKTLKALIEYATNASVQDEEYDPWADS